MNIENKHNNVYIAKIYNKNFCKYVLFYKFDAYDRHK